jgi:uncharacterized protein
MAYYERAFDLLNQIKPSRLSIRHSFQTNGILVTQSWIDFFKAHNVRVGLSLDGPEYLHDRYRRTRARTGTFSNVMRGLRLLCYNEYPFHVITVLTSESLKSARELFDFYVGHGISEVGFNIEEIEGTHTSSSLLNSESDSAIRRFYRDFMELMARHPNNLQIREFMGACHSIVNPVSIQYGNPMAEPLRTISVGVNGELSTFSPELLGYGDGSRSFVFGNVHHNDISDILDDVNFQAVNAEIQRGLVNCRRSCEYYEICQGGCPANKFFENGSFESTETLFCRLSKKAVIDVVLEQIESSMAAAQ